MSFDAQELYNAAAAGNLIDVKALLNKISSTALHVASKNDKINVVNFLLSVGANVNIKEPVCVEYVCTPQYLVY